MHPQALTKFEHVKTLFYITDHFRDRYIGYFFLCRNSCKTKQSFAWYVSNYALDYWYIFNYRRSGFEIFLKDGN